MADEEVPDSGRAAIHRAFCERQIAAEPWRERGFDSPEAFVEDCIEAQFEYDRNFGEDAR